MSVHAKHSGTWKFAVPYAKHSGTWKKAKEVWAKYSGAWEKVFSNLVGLSFSGTTDVTCIPDSIGAPCSGGGDLTATPDGGSGSYSYQWTVTQGSCSLVNATSQTVTWTMTADYDTIDYATLKCTITDNSTGTVVNDTQQVSLRNVGLE